MQGARLSRSSLLPPNLAQIASTYLAFIAVFRWSVSSYMKRMDADRLNLNILQAVALAVIALLLWMVGLLLWQAWEAARHSGWNVFTSSWWNPAGDEFGALALVYGTVVTSICSLMLATPLALSIALLSTEVLPRSLGNWLGLFVEAIAAIPSIVFGLWGVFYLAPWVRSALTPALKNHLGFLPFFQGSSFGIGMLTAILILSLMMIPTMTSLCREIFKTVPLLQKEAALALSATRWEMMKLAVLRPNLSGIVGSMVLGLGRALGETMAVAMVIGNQAQISSSFFAPASTMASIIANEYAEAESDLHVSALCLVGLGLFLITLISNMGARLIVRRSNLARRG